MIQHEKYFISITERETVCLHHFYINKKKQTSPIFMLHGAMESSKIFHSKSGKGLAPFLAKKGFDIFTLDMRGKGESTPKVSKDTKQSQSDQIMVDIPACIDKIHKLTNKDNFHFVGHSWGGVLLLSYIARFPETKIKSAVYFGSKRRISVFSLKRVFYIDIMWNLVGSILGYFKGYVPFKKMKAGSDDEPLIFYKEMNKWVYSKNWIDQKDKFDYQKQLSKLKLPPSLYLTGVKDHTLGNKKDVKLLIKETGSPVDSHFKLLSKKQGNLVDYDHINILTHPLANKDHFEEVFEWINKND